MNKSAIVIVLLLILSLLGFGLYWSSKSEINKSNADQNDRIVEVEAEKALLLKETDDLKKQREQIAQKAEIEAEARRMAEAQALKAQEEKNAMIAALNEKLNNEAAERMEAEAAQKVLESKIVQLAESQKLAQKRLAELEAAKTAESETPKEALVMKEQLDLQKTQLAQLESENNRLKSRQDELLKKQMETEEAIMKVGGKVEILYPEMLSPNFRRKNAIFFKERVSPHSDG